MVIRTLTGGLIKPRRDRLAERRKLLRKGRSKLRSFQKKGDDEQAAFYSRLHESQLEEWKHVSEKQFVLGNSFDRYMLTITGGAVGFSITLFKDFIGYPSGGLTIKPIAELPILRQSWYSFGLSFVLVLACLLVSQWGLSLQKRNSKEYWEHWWYGHPRVNWFYTIATILRLAAAVFLTLGVYLLGSFAFANILPSP